MRSRAPADSFDVAVIGLGAMGSAALYHLASRGLRAIGFEQFALGHDRGSSHGESRVIRLGYAEKPFYVPFARAAFEDWRGLERATGEQLLVETGLIEAGPMASAAVEGSRTACEAYGLPYDLLSAGEANRRWPAFSLPADYVAIHQPLQSGGFVRADLASSLHRRLAREHGAEIAASTTVRAIEPMGSTVRLSAGGRAVEAARVVVAAGAWTTRLLPDMALPLTLTRQVICWFEPDRRDLVGDGSLPVFFVDGAEDGVYGFPYLPGHGLKAASHRQGRVLASADAAVQDAGEADGAAIGRFLRRYVPGAAGRLKAMKTCIYANLPDEDFVIDLLPADPRIVVVSACSGHGFKFAGVIGGLAADLATDRRPDLDLTPFRLDRPSLAAPSGR